LIADWTLQRLARARLLNISVGGALVESSKAFSPNRALRVGLENVPEIGWADAKVMRSEESRRIALRL
jgi:hypothetical protein